MAKCTVCGRKMPPLTFGNKKCKWCLQYEAAQRGELPEDAPQTVMAAPWQQPIINTKLMTQILIGANVLVFVAMVISGVSPMNPSGQALVHWGSNYSYYTIGGQWWRLLSNMFLHGGIIHLACNMWGLWVLGTLAEAVYGRWTYLAIYLTTGVSASVASLFWHPLGNSVGASGAIFGLFGALIASFYFGEFNLPRAVITSTMRNLIFYAVINLGIGASIPFIDNSAHIGGLVAGLILGALVAKVAANKDAVLARGLIVAVVVAIAIGGYAHLRVQRAYLIQYQRGIEFMQNGDTANAINRLQLSIHENPNFKDAHLALVGIYWKQNNFAQVESEIKHVVALAPNTPGIYHDLGVAQLNQKKYDDAIVSLKKAQTTTDDRDTANALATAYAAKGDTVQAAAEAKHASSLPEENGGDDGE